MRIVNKERSQNSLIMPPSAGDHQRLCQTYSYGYLFGLLHDDPETDPPRLAIFWSFSVTVWAVAGSYDGGAADDDDDS